MAANKKSSNSNGAGLALIAELLPPTARELLSLLGEADALALMRGCPGQRLRVPRAMNDKHVLAHTLSGAAYKAMVRRFGGQDLHVPNCKAALLKIRDAQMVSDYDAGLTPNALCLKYGLTHRAVQRALNRPVAEGVGSSSALNALQSRGQLSLL